VANKYEIMGFLICAKVKNISSTTVLNKSTLYIQKRFTGSNKPGHAHKIINIIHNNKQISTPQLASTPKTPNGTSIANTKPINEVPYTEMKLDRTLAVAAKSNFNISTLLEKTEKSLDYLVKSSIPVNKSEWKVSYPENKIEAPKFVVIAVSEDYRKANDAGSPLPTYELNHFLIMEVRSGRIFAQFTSSSHAPNAFVFSNVKLDGKAGLQYVSQFKYARLYTYNEVYQTNGYEINQKATELLNSTPARYALIKSIFEQCKKNTAVDRIHKDDSRFYEEDGQRVASESKEPLPVTQLKMHKLLADMCNPTLKNNIETQQLKSNDVSEQDF
jgi:hypothetical protein